jgi:serine/threonine-protein kinase RsbW
MDTPLSITKNSKPGETVPSDQYTSWLSLSALPKLHGLLDDVTGVMGRFGYNIEDVFAVRLALEEAVVNAIEHGHDHDLSKRVRVWWAVTPVAVTVVVEDEGPGFDPARVPDPRLPENAERPDGRGLYLIHAYMSWVQFNHRGNRLAMCRQRRREAR